MEDYIDIDPDAPDNLKTWWPPDVPIRHRFELIVEGLGPRLVWDSETPAFAQVQISTDSAFSEVGYDSGWVLAGSSHARYGWRPQKNYWYIHPAEDGMPPTLAPNTPYYWRVRIQNDGGGMSEWSAAAAFTTPLAS